MEVLDFFHQHAVKAFWHIYTMMWRCLLNQSPDYYALHAVVTLQQNHPET